MKQQVASSETLIHMLERKASDTAIHPNMRDYLEKAIVAMMGFQREADQLRSEGWAISLDV